MNTDISINILFSFSQDLGIYLLSHVNPRSTIDVTKLNCCVRKGNRCTPRTIDTKILKKRTVILKLSSEMNSENPYKKKQCVFRSNEIWISIARSSLFHYFVICFQHTPRLYSYQHSIWDFRNCFLKYRRIKSRTKSMYKYHSCY